MKRRIPVTLVVIACVGAVIWFMLWMRAPAEGTVYPTAPSKRTESTFQDKALNGEYISARYSGKYVITKNTPANNDLERYTLSAGTNYDKRILVSVITLPDGQLDTLGDYIYRQKATDTYVNRQLQTAAGHATVWTKKDGSEQTVMIPRMSKAIIVSFTTSPSADADLTAEVEAFLSTLNWKKS